MTEGKYETVNEETGEITEEVPNEERIEVAPQQQEIIPPGHQRAADGAIMQTTAHTAGNFVDMLEDGQYSADVQKALQGVAAQMEAITNATGTKTKGRVTMVFDLEREGEHFQIRAKVTTKPPELPRPKTVAWTDHRGNFTRFPPGQAQMFGTRPVRNPT